MEEIINSIINSFLHPTPMFIVAQILGGFALVSTVVSLQLKKKHNLMVLQTISELLIVLQYFCLGAWAGGLISCVSLFRNFILTKFYDQKRAPFWFLVALYAALICTTSYSMFIKGEGAIALLPFIGSLVYTTTLWYGKAKWIRLGNAVGNTPYVIYTALSQSYIVMIMTIIEVISAITGFIRIEVLGQPPKKSSGRPKNRPRHR